MPALTVTVTEVRKFIVALVGAAAEAVNAGLVPGNVAKWVGIGIGVLTAAGVYVVPNKPAPAPAPVPAKP